MSRARLNKWLAAVTSERGPQRQRDRHVCHALAYRMRGDGRDGCFPGQRNIAEMTRMNRRTIKAALDRLLAVGWLEREERFTRYKRKSYRYFPAIPDERAGAPMSAPAVSPSAGVARVHQLDNAATGAVGGGFGALSDGTGASRVHQKSLPEISLKSVAEPSPSPAARPVNDGRKRLRLRAQMLAIQYPYSQVATRMGLSEAEVRLLLDEALA
jgi:hypothetical protein